jgi:hypothetical protein
VDWANVVNIYRGCCEQCGAWIYSLTNLPLWDREINPPKICPACDTRDPVWLILNEVFM